MDAYFIGVELGQMREATGLAVLERAELTGAWDPYWFRWRKMAALWVRHLERLPAGTTYPEMARRVREIARSPELRGRCVVVADVTGVGSAAVELLRRADLGCNVYPVLITGAEQEGSAGSFYTVPKRDLIVAMQILLQRSALRIAEGLPEGPELVEEMAGMEVKVTLSGQAVFRNVREGQRDDLVLAIALACWRAQKEFPSPLEGEDGCWRREDQEAWEMRLKGLLRDGIQPRGSGGRGLRLW